MFWNHDRLQHKQESTYQNLPRFFCQHDISLLLFWMYHLICLSNTVAWTECYDGLKSNSVLLFEFEVKLTGADMEELIHDCSTVLQSASHTGKHSQVVRTFHK
jgi:hypothetical protein